MSATLAAGSTLTKGHVHACWSGPSKRQLGRESGNDAIGASRLPLRLVSCVPPVSLFTPMDSTLTCFRAVPPLLGRRGFSQAL